MSYLLVVEDDKQILQFVTQGLMQAGHSVEGAKDVLSAQAFMEAVSFDLVVVDIMLAHGGNGMEMVKQWRDTGIAIPIIFLSAKDRVGDRLAGFNVGADDYLCKPFSFAELQARVNSLLRRAKQKPLGTTTLTYADITLDLLRREVARKDTDIDLQRREFMLLEYMMENAEQVLGKTMILERVWGYDFDPQTNVVDVLISRLRSKIDKGFSVPLIHTVRGIGYVLKKQR